MASMLHSRGELLLQVSKALGIENVQDHCAQDDSRSSVVIYTDTPSYLVIVLRHEHLYWNTEWLREELSRNFRLSWWGIRPDKDDEYLLLVAL